MTRTRHTSHRRGVVMVITLIAMLLLIALVLWVINLGEQVDKRQTTQDAADATAMDGAGWMARSMNTVAQNNIAVSRYVAMVNVLDALPMATEFAYIEQTSLREALDDQLGRGVGSGPASLMNEVRDLLEDFRDELDEEIEQLEPVNEMFDDIDVRDMTWYNAPSGGMGRLWQAMYALDEVNQSLMENLGDLSQLMAVSAGKPNLSTDTSGSAFIVPLQPQVPHRRGQFNDFERPVKYGILPQQTDDKITRRGPYDTIFGWHRRVGECISGHSRPPTSAGPGGRGNVPIGRGAGGSGGGWSCDEWRYTHYRTWGTHQWLLDRVGSFHRAHLRNTRLSGWTRQIANAKLAYLWPGTIDADGNDVIDPGLGDIEIDQIIKPEWEINFSRAISEAAAGNVKETAFFAVEIKSRYPVGHPSFMTDGSWAPDGRGGRWQPHIVRVGGWEDPRNWESFPTVTKVVNYGWREEWEYQMLYDPEIGLTPVYDDLGRMVRQTVYRIDHFYFAGVNIGEEVDIDNPYQGFNKNDADSPAPTDLRHDLVTTNPDDRRQYLTCLSIVRQPDRPRAWRSAFHGGKPYPNMVGIAQVKIFNNHSWDMWTPMWHAQLEPVSDYDGWVSTLGTSGVSNTPGLDMADVEDLHEYLNAASGLAPAMLEH